MIPTVAEYLAELAAKGKPLTEAQAASAARILATVEPAEAA